MLQMTQFLQNSCFAPNGNIVVFQRDLKIPFTKATSLMQLYYPNRFDLKRKLLTSVFLIRKKSRYNLTLSIKHDDSNIMHKLYNTSTRINLQHIYLSSHTFIFLIYLLVHTLIETLLKYVIFNLI